MGILDLVRGRNDSRHANNIAQTGVDNEGKNPADVSADLAVSDSDNLSLEARNDKEIREHPDQITVEAQPGIRKAEAAAMVWSKPAVYCTYAW